MRALWLVVWALVLGGCAASSPVATDRNDAAIAPLIDRIAKEYSGASQMVGLVVTVARDGEIVHDAAYGLARRSPDVPARPSVPFELFSLSEPVTAVLLLRLAERGLLDLDAPAGQYVHGLPEDFAAASLRQLLRHSSGNLEIPIDERVPEPRLTRAPSRAELRAWLASGPRAAAPDETWIYTSAGYLVAVLAAEDVTRQPYGELIRSEMAEPLGLAQFANCSELDRTRAHGYMVADGATQPVPAIDYGWFAGMGSLCATTGDLARWWLAVRSGRSISPAALQEWMTPLTLERNGARAVFGYGLGMRLGAYRGHTVIGHTGDGAGGTSVLAEYPDDRLLIVVATNTTGADVPHAIEIQAAIARELLGLETPALRVATIEPEALASVPGLYRSPEGTFCLQAAEETLQLSTDEEQMVRLSHVGGGRFARPDDPDSIEYFLGWPDRTEWFGYAWFGMPMDLATRVSDDCQ
jgi:D-alanyl-D-alanine carboxypeptidase